MNLLTHGARSSEPASLPAVSIRCFGEFGMTISGRPVAMGSMKPRTRALLRRLCVDAGAPIHREVLQEALWPNTDPDAAARNLHVAISSLRHALEPGVGRGASSMIVRDGDTYRLTLPPRAEVDVQEFDYSLERSRHARLSGDEQTAVEAFREAVRSGQKRLLPEAGAAAWAVATTLVSNGRAGLAAEAAVPGVESERSDTGLWGVLVEAGETAGDKA